MDIQAAYKREKAMDEKFDRIMELLEKMMPASKSESEPELCASVEEDSSEPEVTDSDWFSVQLHELKQFMRETKSQSSVFNSKSNVLVVESTPEKVESGEVFEDIESDMTAENIILSEVDVTAESGKEDFSLDVDLHSDSEKSTVIDCTDTEVTSDKFFVDGSSAFLWSKDDLGKCDEHDDLNEEIRFEASLVDLISNFSFRISGVCRNASMNRPTHFTMHMDLSNRLNHILPPKKKIRVLKPPAKPPDDDVLQDVVTWNSFISGLMQCSRCRDAMKVFREMVSLRPNEIVFASVLTACGRMGLIDTGKMIHGLIVVGEYSAAVYLDFSLIDMYGKCREVNNARKGFDRMPERNVVSWSSIISGYAQSDLYMDAIQMFREMQNEGFKADPPTISSVAFACGNLGALDQGRWVHSFSERIGIEMNLILKNAFIDMYLKCGEVEKALDIFEKMEFRDVFSWTAMISGLVMNRNSEAALALFSQMKRYKDVSPNEVTFIGVLTACSHGGFVDKGYFYLKEMTQCYDLHLCIEHYGCFVDLLGRANLLDEALKFIDNLPVQPDAVMRRSLLFACRSHGNIELAEYAAAQIRKLDPTTCGSPVLLSNVYASALRWGDVKKVKENMAQLGMHEQPGCSSIEINGVLHEFLLKVHPEVKYVVDTNKGSIITMSTPTSRVTFQNDNHTLHFILQSKVNLLGNLMKGKKGHDSFVNDGLLMWFATEKMVKTYFNYYHGPSIVLIDKELQAWYFQAVITSHTVYKDAEWWPFLVSFSNNIFMFSVPRPPEVAEFDHEINLEAKEKVMPFGQAYLTTKVLHLMNKCNQATLKCADVANLEDKVFPKDGGMMRIGNLEGEVVF